MNDAKESTQAALLFFLSYDHINLVFILKSLTLYKLMIPIPRIRLTKRFLYYLLPFKLQSKRFPKKKKRNDTGLQYNLSIAYV